MSWFTRLFSSRGGAATAEPNQPDHDAPEAHDAAEAEAEPGAAPMPVRQVEVAPGQRRSRQEMIEELEKSYREVVELVRRVKTHLDDQEERAATMMRVAERVERMAPAVESLPDTVASRTEQASQQMTDAIERSDQSRAAIANQITESLAGVADQIERARGAQERLASTVLELSGTVGDVANSSRRSGDALEALEQRGAERDERLAELVKKTERSMNIGLMTGFVMAALAVAVAVVALVRASQGA